MVSGVLVGSSPRSAPVGLDQKHDTMNWHTQAETNGFESEVRKRIYEYIEDAPGVHLRRLQRRMGIPLSTLEYHLHRLERRGVIRRHHKKNRKGLYPAGKGLSTWDRDLLFHLRQGHRGDLLCRVHARPGILFQELCEEMQLAPSTVSYHARDLVSDGLLAERRQGREKAYEPADARRFIELVRRYGNGVRQDSVRAVLRTLLEESDGEDRGPRGLWPGFRVGFETGTV